MTYFLLPDPRKQLRHHCRFAKLSSLSNQGRPPFLCFFFFFPDRTVSVGAVAAAAAVVHLGSFSIQLSSAFKCGKIPHSSSSGFYFCLFLFFLYLSLSDVGMLRFQTSVALWDRSSVSAGSVTVSLYQLQCLVEV